MGASSTITPIDALSRKEEVDTTADNKEMTLLKEEDQDHHV